jgi:hypothetical protein
VPRNKNVPRAGGDTATITKNVPNVSGSELKGARVRKIGQPYQCENANGTEYQICQLEETGGVVGVPTRALRSGHARRSLVSIPGEAWEKLFGRKRK